MSSVLTTTEGSVSCVRKGCGSALRDSRKRRRDVQQECSDAFTEPSTLSLVISGKRPLVLQWTETLRAMTALPDNLHNLIKHPLTTSADVDQYLDTHPYDTATSLLQRTLARSPLTSPDTLWNLYTAFPECHDDLLKNPNLPYRGHTENTLAYWVGHRNFDVYATTRLLRNPHTSRPVRLQALTHPHLEPQYRKPWSISSAERSEEVGALLRNLSTTQEEVDWWFHELGKARRRYAVSWATHPHASPDWLQQETNAYLSIGSSLENALRIALEKNLNTPRGALRALAEQFKYPSYIAGNSACDEDLLDYLLDSIPRMVLSTRDFIVHPQVSRTLLSRFRGHDLARNDHLVLAGLHARSSLHARTVVALASTWEDALATLLDVALGICQDP